MIAELQTRMIALLEEYNSSNAYARQIKEYGGELRNPKNVKFMPSVYVDTISSGRIVTEDNLGELYNGTFTPEIILFANNKASGAAKRDSLANGIDWVLGALKGKFIEVSGVQVKVAEEIQFRTITDYFKPVAIIRPTITIQED